uniref:Myb/SANT-like DNA-binding domain-containing protein n=1 Tax=Chelonoidis abingdonii TaxID=106734 RepID=A0A8C0IX21_CHEAB
MHWPGRQEKSRELLNFISCLASLSQNRKRAPAWTEQEVRDLIAAWGDESMLDELQSSKQNAKTFEKVSKGMKDRGYNRDSRHCCMKIKELRQAYQKTREANGRSRSQPQTCCFCDELHAILGGGLPDRVDGEGTSGEQTISECRRAQYECEERWRSEESKWQAEDDRWCQLADRRQESMLRLLEHQTRMLQRMVELQERQQEYRLPIQPLYNQPTSSPSSIASSPRRPRTRCGGLSPPSHSTPEPCPSNRTLAFNMF